MPKRQSTRSSKAKRKHEVGEAHEYNPALSMMPTRSSNKASSAVEDESNGFEHEYLEEEESIAHTITSPRQFVHDESSIPESALNTIDDENSIPEDVEEEELEPEDPELLFFIKHGRFEDDLLPNRALPKRLADNFRPREYHQNDIVKMINQDVNKMTMRTDEEKENLKTALKEVMLEKKQRKEAIVDHHVDWCLFTSTISRIYKKLELSNFGARPREIPEFELNLLEICLDNKVDTTVDGENVTGPSKKKFKVSMDPSTSSLSTSHATFNRRLGDCVPEHWRNPTYTDLVKFCIRKSIDMTMSLKADRDDLEGTLKKCGAIENVILDNGNAKTAAINFGINYSTLHNYTHRAMVTIAKVMGDYEVPDQTLKLLKKKTSYEEICKAMNVKRAPTLARFIKGEQPEKKQD